MLVIKGALYLSFHARANFCRALRLKHVRRLRSLLIASGAQMDMKGGGRGRWGRTDMDDGLYLVVRKNDWLHTRVQHLKESAHIALVRAGP